ncbi:dihydrolipoyl dehydrogenase [Oscillospiraceae bacterium OttesenSCG-928-G22]|nr:dihydrolipoyl dehydrogenase [Oscillospiraceae bacterium OttesenSCG-928-G22]
MSNVAIIGGGPGGYVAAIRAAQRGLSVTLFEKEHVGGVCLNRGCIPTKTLLKSAEVLETLAGEAEEAGIRVSGVEVDYPRILARKDEVSTRLRGGISELLKANGVTVISEEARLLDGNTIAYAGGELKADHIIVATGSRPAVPPVPGADLPHVLTSDGALTLENPPETLAIIGGGVIGIEFASFFAAMGVKVTVVEMLDRVLATADADISKEMARALKRRKVQVMTGTKLLSIGADAITVETKAGEKEIPAEKVLMAVGRRPNVENLGLEAAGVAVGRGGIETDAYCRTSVPNIYAIGDVNGRLMLAHKASEEGIAVVENIAAGKDAHKVTISSVPACVYGSPETASVGKTEQELIDAGVSCLSGKFQYQANGRAMIEGSRGFVKVLLDGDSHRILGVHIIGKHACELIMEGTLAVANGLTAEQIVGTVHPHPSMSEAFSEAVQAALGEAIHMLNPKRDA